MQLVRRHGNAIGLQLDHGEGDAAQGLHGIEVQHSARSAHLAAQRGHGCGLLRQQRAGFIVGVQQGHQRCVVR